MSFSKMMTSPKSWPRNAPHVPASPQISCHLMSSRPGRTVSMVATLIKVSVKSCPISQTSAAIWYKWDWNRMRKGSGAVVKPIFRSHTATWQRPMCFNRLRMAGRPLNSQIRVGRFSKILCVTIKIEQLWWKVFLSWYNHREWRSSRH